VPVPKGAAPLRAQAQALLRDAVQRPPGQEQEQERARARAPELVERERRVEASRQ
jgi:hypothetical protein